MTQARRIKQIGVAAAFTLAVLVAPGSVQAQDDSVEGNSIWNLEQRVWGGIVRGLGLRDPNAPQIDYRERSPLVVPPTRELPPPQARARPRDPDWPKDPDVVRARQASDAKRKHRSNAATAIESQGAPITPSELERGTVASRAGQSGGSNAPAPGSDPGRPVLPSELGPRGSGGGLFSGWSFGFSGYKDETGTFTGEPARTELTEPPPGYQTPSPSQPYGVTKRIERTKTEQFDPAGRQDMR